jgi:hypothetical protein
LIGCASLPTASSPAPPIGWSEATAYRLASPAPKANEDLARAKFFTEIAKAKNASALGVRVNAIVMICQFFSSSQICFLYQNLEAVIYEKLSEQTLQLCYHNSFFLFSSFHL